MSAGRVVAIYLRPSSRTPVKAVERAQAVAGKGLEGDHAGGGRRQITLISREAWRDAMEALGGDELDPGSRRANVLVEGVDLAASLKQRLRIGDVVVEVVGETKPCGLMDDVRLGLRDALGPACRGGVYGRILTGGEIAPGAPVTLEVVEATR